jgi:hypothetical protein
MLLGLSSSPIYRRPGTVALSSTIGTACLNGEDCLIGAPNEFAPLLVVLFACGQAVTPGQISSRRERHQCTDRLADALTDLLDRPGTVHLDQNAKPAVEGSKELARSLAVSEAPRNGRLTVVGAANAGSPVAEATPQLFEGYVQPKGNVRSRFHVAPCLQ